MREWVGEAFLLVWREQEGVMRGRGVKWVSGRDTPFGKKTETPMQM